MKRTIAFLAILFFALIYHHVFAENPPKQKSYDVEWTTPSPDAEESIPLSGCYGSGTNVRVQDGALWLYLAHKMTYDEKGSLMKLQKEIWQSWEISIHRLTSFHFFGLGHDWVPDHNWVGSGMVGLQKMFMAAYTYGDEKIYLLPAWTLKWDVDFKLHSLQQTVIEASIKNVKVVSLKVTPETRRKHVIMNPDFEM